MLSCGVDEAGRGSMVGPLVVAGVALRPAAAARLSRMGVRDSKALPPARREELCARVLELADGHAVYRIGPREVDRSVRRHALNDLEARHMAAAVARLGAPVSYVDACDVDAARFGRRVSELSGRAGVRSRHRADSRFVVVSAASIVAKVARDRSVARIRRRHDVGSGYPSDRRTVRFVRAYYREHGRLPPFVRASWRPAREIAGG